MYLCFVAYGADMKKMRISTVITVLLGVLVVVLLVSPGTKAWVSRGLMKAGLFKPDLEQPNESASTPVNTSRKPSVFFADGDGNRIDVTNQEGKVVFINFWATWCPPCIAEMPTIDKLYQRFKDNDQVVFVMADVDGQFEKSAQFVQQKKWSLPVHIPAGEIPAAWLGGSIPTTIILDKHGEVAAKHEGMADYSRPEVAEFLEKLIAE